MGEITIRRYSAPDQWTERRADTVVAALEQVVEDTPNLLYHIRRDGQTLLNPNDLNLARRDWKNGARRTLWLARAATFDVEAVGE